MFFLTSGVFIELVVGRQHPHLSKVENVALIHLSDRNSDEERFVEQVKKVMGKVVNICKWGVNIVFDKHYC